MWLEYQPPSPPKKMNIKLTIKFLGIFGGKKVIHKPPSSPKKTMKNISNNTFLGAFGG